MSILRRALLLLFVLNLVSAVAQEPAERERPERFLMLLKPGDKVSWRESAELSGYRLSVYSKSQFAEMTKDRAARQAEINSLKAELGDTPQSIRSSDQKSTDSDVQRRVQRTKRLSELMTVERRISSIGDVAFVGQDYVALTGPGDESIEVLIPAWRIVQIGHHKERKAPAEMK